jgi:putative addiction module component (TIGR02574 family)
MVFLKTPHHYHFTSPAPAGLFFSNGLVQRRLGDRLANLTSLPGPTIISLRARRRRSMSVIDDLSPAEKLSLIEELWDSLDDSQVPVTAAQRAEIDQRLATADADAKRGATWEQLKATLNQRHR